MSDINIYAIHDAGADRARLPPRAVVSHARPRRSGRLYGAGSTVIHKAVPANTTVHIVKAPSEGEIIDAGGKTVRASRSE